MIKMLNKYLSWLYTVLCSLEIETNDIIRLHLKGTILELIICLEKKFKMYDDIDALYKLKYGMSINDNGIDVIDINNNIIGQCKYFKPKSKVSDHILGTFLRYIINLNEFNFKYHLYLSENVKCNFIKNLEVFNISEETINKWIDKAKEHHKLFIEDEDKLTIHKKEDIILYDFQSEVLDIMNKEEKDIYYFNIFCGCGKSIIMMDFINKHLDKKHLILVPNILLAEQFELMLNEIYNIKSINKCYTNTNKKFNDKNNICICVYNSFSYINFNDYNYIYVDEAHHIRNKNNIEVIDEDEKEYEEESEIEVDEGLPSIEKAQPNEAFASEDEDNEIIGYTQKIYDDLITSNNIKFCFSATLLKNNVEFDYDYDMKKAINDNIICDFDINIHLLKKCDDISIMKQLKLFTKYQKILIYCNSVNKIKSLCELYNNNSLKSDYIEASIPIKERINIINKLKTNEIRILFSVNTLSEGIDIKCVDSCLFLDDRNSIINVIQCIGRIIRKDKDKEKGHLIFFSDDINKCSYTRYLNILHKYLNYFNNRFEDNNIKYYKKIKVYNEIQTENNENNDYEYIDCDNYLNEIIIKDVIKNINVLKLNMDDKLLLCQSFYNLNKRLPKAKEYYYFDIYHFINNIRNNKYGNILKKKIEEIFKCILIYNYKKKLTKEEKIILCQKFYEINKRLPYDKEKFENFNIGSFIGHIKDGDNKDIKEEIEKIFNTKLERIKKINNISIEDKIKLCREFYIKNNRLPKSYEVYNDFKIGRFITKLKYSKNEKIKLEIEQIFKQKIQVNKVINKISNEQKIILCQKFYNEFHRLPLSNQVYNNFNIGIFICEMKNRNRNSKIKGKIEEIFHTKL